MRLFIRQSERLFLFGGVAAALVLALSAANSGSRADAQSAGTQVTTRIATVDILGLTERLVGSPEYVAARDTQVSSLNKGLEPLIAEGRDLIAKLQAMADQNSKDAEALKTQLGEKQQRLQQMDQDARNQIETFNTTQVEKAYRAVVDASDALGAQLGYTHVIASRTGNVVIRSRNVPGAVQEILARPVIRGLAGDDLTERLAKQLNLPAPAAEPVKAEPIPAAGGAPAQPAAPGGSR